MNFEQARSNMIEQQIKPWDVPTQSVLDLISEIQIKWVHLSALPMVRFFPKVASSNQHDRGTHLI